MDRRPLRRNPKILEPPNFSWSFFYPWILKSEMKPSRKICQMTEVELSILEPNKMLFSPTWLIIYKNILTCLVTDTLGILMIFISGYRHISVVIFWIKDTVRGYGKSFWDPHESHDLLYHMTSMITASA